MKCTYCGSAKHTIKNCSKTNDGWINRMHMYCIRCGSKKHNVKACPRICRPVIREQLHDHYIKD